MKDSRSAFPSFCESHNTLHKNHIGISECGGPQCIAALAKKPSWSVGRLLLRGMYYSHP